MQIVIMVERGKLLVQLQGLAQKLLVSVLMIKT